MTTSVHPSWQVKMLYDGQCPLCSREVVLLRRHNVHGRVAFEDIADPAFEPARYGLTLEEVIGAMHAVRPDGSIVRGIDVFAEVYEAVGWRWLAWPIRWRMTRPAMRVIYHLFAAIRPRLSGFKSENCTTRCRLPGNRT